MMRVKRDDLLSIAFLGGLVVLGVPACSGSSGPPGAKGDMGSQGTAGPKTLGLTTILSRGTQCPAGGQLLQLGVDANGDGTLEASEVQQSAVVCNGAPGDAAAGPQGPPGPQGPAGSADASSPGVGDLGGNLGFAHFKGSKQGLLPGGSTAVGFTGWSVVTGFGFSMNTPFDPSTAVATAGASASPVTVSLVFDQGTAGLNQALLNNENLSDVELAFQTAGATPSVLLRVSLTNANVVNITSTSATGSTPPQVSLSLLFQRIQLEYDGPSPDGGMATTFQWDNQSQSTTSTPAGTPALDFAINGPATPPVDVATSFTPPQAMLPTSSGQVTGRAGYAPASVSLPVDATVIDDFIVAATGKTMAQSTVQLFQGAGATATPYASYQFTNAIIASASLSGVNATLTFPSTAYTLTEGSSMTTIGEVP